jgi:hypothetical protein
VAAARAAFEFLEEHGARVELEDRPDQSVLAYIYCSLVFEVELNWRERAVFLLVGRAPDGRRPPGYYMYNGKRVRLHLAQALMETGVLGATAVERLRTVTRGSGFDAMRSQVPLLAATLEITLDDLIERYDLIPS